MSEAVGVNLLWLRPGVVGGSEEYLCRQLAGLDELDHHEDLVLFALPGFAEAHPELAGRPIETAPVSGGVRAARVAVERTWLARRTAQLALVHHGGGTLPAPMPGFPPSPPTVLTIHDLQYLRFPQHFSPVKRAWLQTAVPRAVRRARVVTVPSGYVRATVVEAFAIEGERIVVVPHGLPTRSASVADPQPSASASPPANGPPDHDAIRRRYGLPGPVIVYPAITYPHKNHTVLVQALARLVPGRPELRLVLLGAEGPAEGAIREEVARLGLGAHVVRPGRVTDADRDAIYAVADVLAFPSRYEGFGAPVLEAMAARLPVVASDAAALPEVVGGAGLLVPWDDPAAWAESIALILDDAAEAALLRAAGEARAATFTAARSARALVHAYRQARS